MGIFDEAIKQHLDLKRRQGADESELKQLEDEAFGLPARPGDPDFPETGETATDGESAAASPPAVEQAAPKQAEAAPESPEPAPERDELPPEQGEGEPAVAEEPAHPDAPREEPAPHGDALLADPDAEPESPATEEGPVEDDAAPGFTTSERSAISDQPTEFFDQAPEPLELGELDLDLKDELDDVGALEEGPLTDEELVEEAVPATEDSPLPEEPAPPEDATPVDELAVVEETEPASETEIPAEPEEASAASEPPAEGEPPADEPPAEGEEGEDVLEETPEFLRDNPDDDELWFEQGEPKDFDF